MKKITKAILKKREKKRLKRELRERINNWKEKIKQGDFCEKCNSNFKELTLKGKVKLKHPHHIISERAVISKYPILIDDVRNGVLLCSQCHKYSSDSAHEGALEFVVWLMKYKPEQYNFLSSFLSGN